MTDGSWETDDKGYLQSPAYQLHHNCKLYFVKFIQKGSKLYKNQLEMNIFYKQIKLAVIQF